MLVACREWARDQGEYGFWGGESEEERAAAGFPVELPIGRVARILRDWRASHPRHEERPPRVGTDDSGPAGLVAGQSRG